MAKDYYECIMQIRVKLQKFHRYIFRPGDLECQAKEAFFNGLRPEFQLMVVHKRDDPSVSIMKLLVTVRECEENQENNDKPAGWSMPRHTHHPPLGMTTATESRTTN